MRERHHLEWIIETAKDDWEAIQRLARWAGSQWENGWGQYPTKDGRGSRLGYLDYCAPWDALETIELAKRNLSTGMCVLHSLVLFEYYSDIVAIVQ